MAFVLTFKSVADHDAYVLEVAERLQRGVVSQPVRKKNYNVTEGDLLFKNVSFNDFILRWSKTSQMVSARDLTTILLQDPDARRYKESIQLPEKSFHLILSRHVLKNLQYIGQYLGKEVVAIKNPDKTYRYRISDLTEKSEQLQLLNPKTNQIEVLLNQWRKLYEHREIRIVNLMALIRNQKIDFGPEYLARSAQGKKIFLGKLLSKYVRFKHENPYFITTRMFYRGGRGQQRVAYTVYQLHLNESYTNGLHPTKISL